MELARFQPLTHYQEVKRLWDRALGEHYPVSERVLRPRICARPTYREGDGVVALDGRRVVGFASAELTPPELGLGEGGAIQAIMVDPAHQRCGIGSALLEALEERLRGAGCTQALVSGGLYRFWTGLPEDLPGARIFFQDRGYCTSREAVDMFAPLESFEMPTDSERTLREAGAEALPASADDLGPALDLLAREAGGWRWSLLTMAAAGDLQNVLLLKRAEQIIGQVQTFTPRSRFRGANVVWERILGQNLGGLGAVLITEDWRGRGLGTALIRAAARHVKQHEGTGCFVDWTSRELEPFYGRIGARIWRSFTRHSKEL